MLFNGPRTAPDEGRFGLRLTAIALAGAALCAIAAQVTLWTPSTSNPGLAAAARALMVGVPIAVGLYAWQRRPDERWGRLLVLVGFGWFLTTLAESGNEVLYSLGRIAGWVVEVGLVYLILAFPSGRLEQPRDRALVRIAALLLAVLYLPTILIAESYPLPSPYTACDAGCPDNAFFVLGSEPGVVDSFIRPLRELLTMLVFLAVTARLVERYRRSTRLMQRTLEPVVTVAAGRCIVLALAIVARLVAPESPALDVLTWTIALAVPIMAVGFFLGLLSRRLYAANALQDLGARASAGLTPDELRPVLSQALGDPSLRVVFWAAGGGGHWADERGLAVAPPRAGPDQSLTEVRDGERPIAAIIHDAALSHERALLDAVASYALIALRTRRMAAKVEESLAEVRESRARILATADRERRRIERDLHDGAQQRLVALRIHIELAEEQMETDPERGRERLHALRAEVGETLDEIRALARGVYPSLLGRRGLADALNDAALRAPIATSVQPDGVGRYPPEVETAVYFCCLEAIQNASKHASGAHGIVVSLSQNDRLRFQVRDDGAGFDSSDSTPGAGFTNMRDRMIAVGGELEILSSERGTVVAGSVPVDSTGSASRG